MEYIETETTRKISELGRNYVKIIMANISYANSMFKYLFLFLHIMFLFYILCFHVFIRVHWIRDCLYSLDVLWWVFRKVHVFYFPIENSFTKEWANNLTFFKYIIIAMNVKLNYISKKKRKNHKSEIGKQCTTSR